MEIQRKQTHNAQNSDSGNDESGRRISNISRESSENLLKEGSTACQARRLKMENRVVKPHILIRILEMEMVMEMVMVMAMEMLMEKWAVSPHILEISTEKRVAKPHLMKVMAMMMVMVKVTEFDEVGAIEGSPLG